MNHYNPFQQHLGRPQFTYNPSYPPPHTLPLPPPPPLPLPPPRPDESSFHTHYHPPSRPQVQPSPLLSHRPPPPPFLYNSQQQTQYSFQNNISHRPLVGANNHHPHLELGSSRPLSNPSRVSPSTNPIYTAAAPERCHSHSFNVDNSVRPCQLVDKFPHKSNGSFEFHADYNNRPGCDGYREKEQFFSNPSRSSRNLGYGDFNPNLRTSDHQESMGNYDVQTSSRSGNFLCDEKGDDFSKNYISDVKEEGLSENYKHCHSQTNLLGFDFGGMNEKNTSDRLKVDSGKRVSFVLDFGKSNSSRESKEENKKFLHAPLKKPQKKNVLLRLQTSPFRNRTELSEKSFDGCQKEDQVMPLNHRVEAKTEGSPVELDVSFRSNTLVAKEISAPSSPADISDMLTTRSRKFRKFTETPMNSLSLQLTNHNSNPVKPLDDSIHVPHGPSCSNEDLNLFHERIDVSTKKPVSGPDSLLCSIGTNSFMVKSRVGESEDASFSDRLDKVAGYDKPPSVHVSAKESISGRDAYIKYSACSTATINVFGKLPFSGEVTDSPGIDSKNESLSTLDVSENRICLQSDKKYISESSLQKGGLSSKVDVSILGNGKQLNSSLDTACSLQSVMPSSNIAVSNLGVQNLVNSSLCTNEDFCSIKKSNLKEGNTGSGFHSSFIGLEPCIDVDSRSQRISSVESFNGLINAVKDGVNNINASSLKSKMERKNLSGCVVQLEDKPPVSVTYTMASIGVPPSITTVLQSDGVGNDCSKVNVPSFDCCSVQESPILSFQGDSSLRLVAETEENASVTTAKILHQNDVMGDSDIVHGLIHGNLIHHNSTLDPKMADFVNPCVHHNEASNLVFDNGPIDLPVDAVCDTEPPKNQSFDAGSLVLNTALPLSENSLDHNCVEEKKIIDEVPKDVLFVHASNNHYLSPKESVKLHSRALKETTCGLELNSGEPYMQMKSLSYAPRNGYSGRHPPSFNTSRNSVSPNTWNRNTIQSGVLRAASYVRKGNSLLRKSDSFAEASHALGPPLIGLNASSKIEMKMKSSVFDNRVDLVGPSNCSSAPVSDNKVDLVGPSNCPNAPLEEPAEYCTPHNLMPSSCSVLGDGICSPQASPLSNQCTENLSNLSKVLETNDAPESSENALNRTSNSGIEINLHMNDVNIASPIQLVAESNSSSKSPVIVDKFHASAASYYKRKKNQLIRTSLKNHSRPTVVVAGGGSNSEKRRAVTVPQWSINRRMSEVKKCKPSLFSLVWTSNGTQSLKKVVSPSQAKKLSAHPVPWKRACHWRGSLQNSASKNPSVSMIGKLLLMRKRDALYTRSSHGFSLWKSKVLSMGGFNLKWSKSLEKRSMKAHEDATMAVAEIEGKKHKGNTSRVGCRTNRNHSSRERIFRIGLDRYKMDSSGKTLQRITDDKSRSTGDEWDNNLKKSYVPRRLLIGNDEYVQIGNGNKLVRDPRKRTRILASEKVRWSLHTARLRLCKKRKYCQFYTRFGKCNKDNSGKCPYIHDPSKIVVCTKFLSGLCSNLFCKLTHKVIPERMQDCSYFVQGLCSNENCPYRHVNVNPNASICEGFLKGYCADGNECRKKHSYVCPNYEVDGSCPQGSKCKLHHPRKQKQGQKRKRTEEACTRYFSLGNSVPKITHDVNGTNVDDDDDVDVVGDDDVFENGKFADFISLDVDDKDRGTADMAINDGACDDDDDEYDDDDDDDIDGDDHHHDDDMGFDDLEKRILPVGIMDLV